MTYFPRKCLDAATLPKGQDDVEILGVPIKGHGCDAGSQAMFYKYMTIGLWG